MAELGTRGTHRKGAGRKLSAYGCARRISTRRAGHVSIGGTRELGRALWLLDAHPGLGDRVTKGPGGGWALRPAHEPCGDTTNERSTQGIGERATSEGPREGQVAVVALHSTVGGGEVRPKRPTEGKATSGRVFRWVRYTRETPSSPIVSPQAASGKFESERLCSYNKGATWGDVG